MSCIADCWGPVLDPRNIRHEYPADEAISGTEIFGIQYASRVNFNRRSLLDKTFIQKGFGLKYRMARTQEFDIYGLEWEFPAPSRMTILIDVTE